MSQYSAKLGLHVGLYLYGKTLSLCRLRLQQSLHTHIDPLSKSPIWTGIHIA